jgi:hypothetical protein
MLPKNAVTSTRPVPSLVVPLLFHQTLLGMQLKSVWIMENLSLSNLRTRHQEIIAQKMASAIAENAIVASAHTLTTSMAKAMPKRIAMLERARPQQKITSSALWVSSALRLLLLLEMTSRKRLNGTAMPGLPQERSAPLQTLWLVDLCPNAGLSLEVPLTITVFVLLTAQCLLVLNSTLLTLQVMNKCVSTSLMLP